jgi:hypothetical protein
MPKATRRRVPRTTNLVNFPTDYPNAYRYQGTEFFCGALGGASLPAFYKYRAEGLIPPPDVKRGHLNAWKETTIAAAVEAFAARSRTAVQA